MKKYILLIITALIFTTSFAQRYKVIYENIKSMDENEAYLTLEAFSRSITNSHSASLYKLSTIIEHRISSYDPFLQEMTIYQNLKNLNLYLNLALLNLNEKVARQDGEYFDGIAAENPKKGPTYEEINTALQTKLENLKLYNKYFEQNRNFLLQAATKYNTCIELFGEINKRNSKLKDLYFLVDESLRQQLNDLQTNFDSTLFYLAELQKSVTEYPMLNYKFKYKLNPINIYRMHGLTQANFLAAEIQLWDFRQWINSFYKTIDDEVAYLHNNVKDLDNQHENYINMLADNNINDVPSNYKVPQYLLNKIYKYDFISLAGSLMVCQQAQIDYLQQLTSFQKDTSFFALNRNTPTNNFFSLSISKKHVSDSLLTDFEKNISEEGMKKYSNVFIDKYNGADGLKQYVNEHADLNKSLFDSKINAIAQMMLDYNIKDSANNHFLIYNSDTIFAQIVPQTEIKAPGYYIHNKSVTTSKQTLISGTYVSPKKEMLGFVASIDTAKNIQWLKQFKQGAALRSCLHVMPINAEIATIVTSTTKTGDITNFMLLLDGNTGDVKQSMKLNVKEMPRKLLVDDIDNKFIIVFGGKSQQLFTMEPNNMHVCCLDSKLNTAWESNIPFTGYICNVVKTNDIYYITGGFSKIKGFDNEETDLENGCGFFEYSIDGDGNWANDHYYDSETASYPLWVSKVDNMKLEVVSLLNNAPQSASDSTTIEAAYIQYSFDGYELFRSK